jgi:uncharacterized membrane protein (DUF441 family)
LLVVVASIVLPLVADLAGVGVSILLLHPSVFAHMLALTFARACVFNRIDSVLHAISLVLSRLRSCH